MTGTTRPTTEPRAPLPPSRDARPQRSGVSVRTRIAASVALLVALALAGAGMIVYVVQSERIEQETRSDIEQEFGELAQLRETGIDPRTGRDFRGVGALLDTFLLRNVPDEHERLVTWYRGGPRNFSPDTAPNEELVESEEFRDAVRPLLTDNSSTTIVVDGREQRIDVQTVRERTTGDAGALVVVTDLTGIRAGLIDTMRTYSIIAALSLLLVTAIAGWQSGRLLAPLRVLRQTAEEIGETDLSRRIPERGNDDITALTRTVNGMLSRLEAAFSAQRRFLDDAGHELRTPLTVLRGHLELLDTENADEVRGTRDLLLDELDRMSRLVGDLILLAKSDRPDFVVPAPSDLRSLTEDVLAKARGLGDRDWTLDEAADGTALLDEQRITQALLQLADNAVKHTGPGAVLAIGSAVDGSGSARLRFWVRDCGPGVSPADRSRIFERFERGRVPAGDEGFGLGLSIVQAIAAAHGGSVGVEDAAPGVDPPGARFEIVVPRRTPPAGVTPELLPEEGPWPAS